MRRLYRCTLALCLVMGAHLGCRSASVKEHTSEGERAEGAARVAAPALPDLPPVAEEAKVIFLEPMADTKIAGPLKDGKVEVVVKMGTENIEVKPAGEVMPNTGHHHLLIDAEPIPAGQVVPKDDKHLHFGGGQTEATIALPPGRHTLALQFADGMHRAYGPQLAATITVEVLGAE